MLKKLHGHAVNWEAIRKRYAPDEKWCRGCKERLAQSPFPEDQWGMKTQDCRCLRCAAEQLMCHRCRKVKQLRDFTRCVHEGEWHMDVQQVPPPRPTAAFSRRAVR